jgi:beta-glucanase (GH16 family)
MGAVRRPRLAMTLAVAVLLLPAACGVEKGNGAPQPDSSARSPDPSASASAAPAAPNVFDDEFNGTELDTRKWTRESGPGYGTESFDADARFSSLDGRGHLVVTDERASDGTWRAGEISTRGAFSMRAGVVEIRAKLPREQGAWPAFWFHNGIHGETGGPHAEIDVMEVFPGGGNGGLGAYLTLHDWSGGAGQDRSQQLSPDPHVLDGKFHTWRLDWDTHRIALSIDGVFQGQLTPATFTAGRWVFNDVPMYFIVGLSVGGGQDLAPLPETSKMQLVLDYVRLTKTS